VLAVCCAGSFAVRGLAGRGFARSGHRVGCSVYGLRRRATAGELLERDGEAQPATALVLAVLQDRQPLVTAGVADPGLRQQPRAPTRLVGEGGQQVDHIHAAPLAGVTAFRARGPQSHGVALADRDRDHVVAQAAADHDRKADLSRLGLDVDHVAELEAAEFLGRARRQLGVRLPSTLVTGSGTSCSHPGSHRDRRRASSPPR